MHPSELAARFRRGDNITALLKEAAGTSENSEEIIETAYDLQAGSYIAALEDPAMRQHKNEYGAAIAKHLRALGPATSLLEPGVGEATTLAFVLDALGASPLHVHGFDLSWSRVAAAHAWLEERGLPDVQLSVASLLQMPFADDSFDVVYTSHTVEPNGGAEREALSELYRVTSRYLVLLEPSWSLAPPDGRRRMERLGYVRDLEVHAAAMGMDVVHHGAFEHVVNPLNPTAITIIAKNPSAGAATPQYRCPRFGDPVEDRGDHLYSPGSLRAYPKIGGLPCLRPELGVLASALSK